MQTIERKTYRIPFRPEYLLLSTDGSTDLTSADKPTGRDVPAYRFHLSEEAHALVRAQDPEVTKATGFCSLTIKFDAAEDGPAYIEVERGIFPTT